MRFSVVPALLLAAALTSCSDDPRQSYPGSVGVLVDGIAEAGLCDAVTPEPEPSAAQAYVQAWDCDGPSSVRVARYSSPTAAATWVAQGQVVALCGRMSAPMDMDMPDHGELLYEEASVYGLVEDLEALQDAAGGKIYTRSDAFPQSADQSELVAQSPCGDSEVDPRVWEQQRTALSFLQ